jgi:hypothetical protein
VGVLSFAASPDDEGDEAFRMTPVVNGTPLTIMIATCAQAQGFRPAGDHDGVTVGPADRDRWARAQRTPGSARRRTVALLGCDCGGTGCRPLEAPVRVEDATVAWEGFRRPHRPKRDYAGFGPFVFDLSTYRAAVTER